ncbi:MAG: CPBP family intramembrane metalloprotease [Bdellovibrionaceae bacterium]|nr:CPBP family intramembrane metalloprotease [Pseudobdellovibrionaceae bacterium]
MQKMLLPLVAVYLIVRFGFTSQLDALGAYASYIFEVICVILALIFNGSKTLALFRFKKSFIVFMLVALVAGFTVFKAASFWNLVIPFDFTNAEGILFLLIFAPLLEELIFRFMLWQPFKNFSKNEGMILVITSVIFSYSHFHAYWFVPAELYGFVIYQSIYTLFLGLASGYLVYKYSSLTGAVVMHFAFNLGFYLGFLNI